MAEFTLVIHGGAGTILRSQMKPDMEIAYRSALHDSLDAGSAILSSGGTAVDAVMAAVRSLEDNILFNAGRGAVFNHEGKQEMDAALMDGKDLRAGAVAAVRNIRNPIDLARRVMTHSEHVFLMGEGAMAFARQQGLPSEPDEYFFSRQRYEQWEKLKGGTGTAMDHDDKPAGHKMGTVGAVACDRAGHLAAATSTGGMTNKAFGRIGDSPIIGAGTYANDSTCAISCTGHGEPFIRAVTAYDVSCLMEYKGCSLKEAMEIVVHDKLLRIEGEGGMIGVDGKGNGEMIFNSEGMYRALRSGNGKEEISIYK